MTVLITPSAAGPSEPYGGGLAATFRVRAIELHGEVDRYLAKARRRSGRLDTMSVVCSVIGAALCAGPAVGGATLNEALRQAFGADQSSTVWRTICAITVVASLCAAVATNLSKLSTDRQRIDAAEASRVQIANLLDHVELGGMTAAQANARLADIRSRVPFVDGHPRHAER